MTTLRTETATSLKDLALAYPAAARVFEALHLDYCCGGAQTLDGACRAAGLDSDEVVARLRWACRQDNPSPPWEQSSLTELIHHIVEIHHAYTHTELALSRHWNGIMNTALRSPPPVSVPSIIPYGK